MAGNAPTYLDDSGNPMAAPPQAAQSGPTYLDDSGNPVQQSGQQASIPANLQDAYSRGQHAPVPDTEDQPLGFADQTALGASRVGTGIAKGAAETVHTVGSFLHDKLGVPMPDEVLRPELEGGTEAKNTGEKAGKFGEAIGEYALGNEAIKGLGLAERIGIAQKVMKISSEHPIIGKAIAIGMNALRSGTVGSGVALAKGATPGQALEAGAGAAATGAALDTVGAGLSAIRSPAKEVQEGIANIAKDAGDATGDIKPTAADPYGFRQVAKEQIGRYKQAANQLDELSKNAFSDAQQEVSDAADDFTAAGKKAYREALGKLDGIIDQYRPELKSAGIDVDSMKADYKAGMANNKIAAFLGKTTEETGSGSPEATAKVGSGLKEAFLDLIQNQKDLLNRAGWTEEHVNEAMNLARQLSKTQTARTVTKVGAGLAGTGVVGELIRKGVSGSW